ncbi:MAG: hypothetical protein HY907_18105 [Deltaproteobacteria bacterium]|nr:hypothetical protein [Deltaproteobacteria bacterium]
MTEWFASTPAGLEHGVDIRERFPGAGDLVLEVSVHGSVELLPGGNDVLISDARGRPWLRYSQLIVVDATGNAVPSRMEVAGTAILFRIDDTRAGYPIRVDPLLWCERGRITASDGEAHDHLGGAVALSGNTAVIGAAADTVGTEIYQGSAYVFLWDGSVWNQEAKLVASDGATQDLFGNAVAINGDTALIAAQSHDVLGGVDQGSVYVFVRTSGAWHEEAQLVASDGAAHDLFGSSVSVRGDTALIGAVQAAIGGAARQGAAYVFVRSAGTWHQEAKLAASDGAAGAKFGNSVALSADRALIGARATTIGANVFQGAAYVFTRTGGLWTQEAKLTASDGTDSAFFGWAVALAGNTAVSTSYSAMPAGAAYAFVWDGMSWIEEAKLTASDGATGDEFGYSVAISGDAIVVGAIYDDVGTGTDQGSAYVFHRGGSVWSEQAKLVAADGESWDLLGVSAAIEDDTAIVGASGDSIDGRSNQGSADVFRILEVGLSCSFATDCPSGHCVDSVCCDTACGGGSSDDCVACGTAAGGETDGVCGPLTAATAPSIVCRPVSDLCDAAETCEAGSPVCPRDRYLPSGTMCRPAAGVCDLDERCTSTSARCPWDYLRSGPCRRPAGVCDLEERCDGVSVDCPVDVRMAAGTVCRPENGPCDIGEVCDGGVACPLVDLVEPSGTVCRDATGDCDAVERCDGLRTACPTDRYVPGGTGCRPSTGPCDPPEACDGIAPSCPVDGLAAAGSTCREPAGECDEPELCSGADGGCPVDAKSTAECRPPAGACDFAEWCDGVSDSCPDDVLVAMGTECRLAVDVCDAPETCDGSTPDCPTDTLIAGGTVCRPGSCVDGAESGEGVCTGHSVECGDSVTSDCAPYVCGTDRCLGSCTGTGDCIGGFACTSGACVIESADADADADADAGADAGARPDAETETGAEVDGPPEGDSGAETASGTDDGEELDIESVGDVQSDTRSEAGDAPGPGAGCGCRAARPDPAVGLFPFFLLLLFVLRSCRRWVPGRPASGDTTCLSHSSLPHPATGARGGRPAFGSRRA